MNTDKTKLPSARFLSVFICVHLWLVLSSLRSEPADAIWSARYVITMDGQRRVIENGAVAIRGEAADTDTLTPPCGACRQILWEFCGDIELILVNPRGAAEIFQLSELFPKPFDASFL